MPNSHNHQNHPAAYSPQPKSTAPKKPDFKTYQSAGEDLGSQGLALALWFEKNKLVLFKALFGTLVALNAFLWVFSLVKWGDYLIFGVDEMKRLSWQAAQSVNYNPLKSHFAARPLEILTNAILPGGVNKYDIVAEVANPNERFLVEFDYSFVLGESERTDVQRTFLLPGETKPLVFLGMKGPLDATPEIAFDNFSWQRISAHWVKDIDAWQKYRLDFNVADFDFKKSGASSLESANADVVTFTLKNNSPFGYKSPEFLFGLYDSQGLVGVKHAQLDDFKSEETKKIDVRSFVPNLNISKVVAFPVINIYKNSSYLPPER